jgi:hypothetical protein
MKKYLKTKDKVKVKMKSVLGSLQVTAQMLTGRSLQYFWDDEASFVRGGSVFIKRDPIPLDNEKHMVLILRAINFHLCGQIIFSEQNGEANSFLHAITKVIEGYRTNRLMGEHFPGSAFYLDLLKIITHSSAHDGSFLDRFCVSLYCFINYEEDEHLDFLDFKDQILDVLVDRDHLETYLDTREMAQRIFDLIQHQIPETELEQEFVLTSLPSFTDDPASVMDAFSDERLVTDLTWEIPEDESETISDSSKEAERLEQAIDWGPRGKKTYQIMEPEANEEVYGRSYERVAKNISYFKQYLRLLIQDLTTTKQLRGQRRGILDEKVMVKAAMGNDRVFKRRYDFDIPSIAFSLLIDRSGSMGGEGSAKCEHARDAAILFSEVLDGLGIPFEVAMFTSDLGDKFTIQHYFVKRWDEEYKRVRARLGDSPGKANNDDGASIRLAMERLDRRPERLRYLIVIGDGNPCGSGRPREFMLETMKLYTGKPIIAIGDPHAELGQWYRWYVRSSGEDMVKNLATVVGNAVRWSMET